MSLYFMFLSEKKFFLMVENLKKLEEKYAISLNSIDFEK